MTRSNGPSIVLCALAATIIVLLPSGDIQAQTAQSVEASATAEVDSTPSTKTADTKPRPERKHHWWGPSRDKMWSVHFLGGAAFFDYDELNERLDAEGYEELANPSIALGIGGDFRWKRLLIGGEGLWLQNVHGESDRDDTKADINAFYGLFRLGFVVFERAGFSIYPLVGIGWGRIEMELATVGGAEFDDVLADPAREVEMEQSGLLLDASLGVDYRYTLNKRHHRESMLLVGLRGGYLFAPYNQSWEMTSGEISGSPDYGLTGPTALLVLGFSSRGTGDQYKGCYKGCHKGCRHGSCPHKGCHHGSCPHKK